MITKMKFQSRTAMKFSIQDLEWLFWFLCQPDRRELRRSSETLFPQYTYYVPTNTENNLQQGG